MCDLEILCRGTEDLLKRFPSVKPYHRVPFDLKAMLADRIHSSCREVATWTQDWLKMQSPIGDQRKDMNRTLCLLQPGGKARTVYDKLRSLIDDALEQLLGRADHAHVPLHIDGCSWQCLSVERLKEIAEDLLIDPIRLWHYQILFDMDTCNHEDREGYSIDRLLLYEGNHVYFRHGLQSSVDPFAERVFRLLEKVQPGHPCGREAAETRR
ncbi:MAG: hypothetical protein HQ592_04110 [Planctomycetes bacterium]|nr:hypothetical protein [Planctomycetota bacterium]